MLRSEVAADMLASTIEALVFNGHVGTAELGNLAQVCKGVNKVVSQDSIWASLCAREYPGSYRDTRVERNGHRWLYKRWSAPIAKQRQEDLVPLGPPSCTANQLVFDVHIKYDGKMIYTSTSGGSYMKRYLLEEGGVKISIAKDASIILGKAQWNCSEEDLLRYERRMPTAVGLKVKCQGFDERKLDVSVHVYNSKDNTMCCVFRSTERNFYSLRPIRAHPSIQEGERVTLQSKFDLTREQQQGILRSSPPNPEERLPMKQTWKAFNILQRLPFPIDFDMDLCLDIVEGGNVGITQFGIHSLWNDSERKNRACNRFDSRKEEKKHGVTLLHILSELQGK